MYKIQSLALAGPGRWAAGQSRRTQRFLPFLLGLCISAGQFDSYYVSFQQPFPFRTARLLTATLRSTAWTSPAGQHLAVPGMPKPRRQTAAAAAQDEEPSELQVRVRQPLAGPFGDQASLLVSVYGIV